MSALNKELEISEETAKSCDIADPSNYADDPMKSTNYTIDHSKDPPPRAEIDYICFRFDQSWKDVEKKFIQFAVDKHCGNKTHASKTLDISIRTIQRKLQGK